MAKPDLQWSPEEHEVSKTLHSKAQDVLFRRGVWQLQFTHKPLRLIEVDIPQPDGKMKRKVVLVYGLPNHKSGPTPYPGPGRAQAVAVRGSFAPRGV